ncbi:MAG: IS21-like element helper ATPase IstB [Firmicutes bacterium]|nr:IS21-like element helper ATPase IstB [Bacillota bacterium]
MSATTPLPPPPAQAVLLESYLRRLRLPAMLAAYPKLVQEAAQAGLTYEQFLLTLVEHEVTQRDENMQRRRIAAARFPALKTLDQYDFSLMPALTKQLVLELAQGHYIAAKENILCVGEIGTGKTHTATALGISACRQGYRVRFVTAAGLANELLEAHAAHRLSRVEQALLRLHLLILDEVGFVPFTKLGADLLFSVLSALHERVRLILTTTVPFADWAQLFGGDQRLAGALLDRLTFHAHLLHFAGDSFRLRHSLQQQEAERRRR